MQVESIHMDSEKNRPYTLKVICNKNHKMYKKQDPGIGWGIS